ncbi:MAG: translation elongation factor Ts [Actinomycetota bacterium]|nr:translation elongation factor Ts [Actinomycetota bacterium]
MSDFTAKDVQTLRQVTGAGMMDAKRALTEVGGDMDRAKDLLREQGLADAAKRADRSQTEGAIGSYLHRQADRPVIGVLIELASETDFVAKSDEFQEIANDIAMHTAAARPRWITRDDVPEDAIEEERRLIAAQAVNEGKPEHIVERIVEGRLNSFFADNVLYDQEFVKSETFDGTVGELVKQLASKMGENISVSKMARLAVGEKN